MSKHPFGINNKWHIHPGVHVPLSLNELAFYQISVSRYYAMLSLKGPGGLREEVIKGRIQKEGNHKKGVSAIHFH